MLIRQGRHVDANGKVYLPYLSDWKKGRSDLKGLAEIMCTGNVISGDLGTIVHIKCLVVSLQLSPRVHPPVLPSLHKFKLSLIQANQPNLVDIQVIRLSHHPPIQDIPRIVSPVVNRISHHRIRLLHSQEVTLRIQYNHQHNHRRHIQCNHHNQFIHSLLAITNPNQMILLGMILCWILLELL